MPLYEYICECGNITTELRFVDNRNKPGKCEKCGKKTKLKMSRPIGFKFKGTGFHDTDYGKSGPKGE